MTAPFVVGRRRVLSDPALVAVAVFAGLRAWLGVAAAALESG